MGFKLGAIACSSALAVVCLAVASVSAEPRKLQAHSTDCLPNTATTFEEFLVELEAALDSHLLPMRPIDYVFSAEAPVPISCRGDWLEFGVFSGGTLNAAARWRQQHCGPASSPVHGFDTFTGLPEEWNHVKGQVGFAKGAFDQGGKFPAVEANVRLHKGLFNDTIPVWMRKSWARVEAEGQVHVTADEEGDNMPSPPPFQEEGTHVRHHHDESLDESSDVPLSSKERKALEGLLHELTKLGGKQGPDLDLNPRAAGTGNRRRLAVRDSAAAASRRELREHLSLHTHLSVHGGHGHCKRPISAATWDRMPGAVSYIHIDCDLYAGASQALTLLTDRIHPGTVLVFDELINYPLYREHEVKALWEWLQSSGRKLRVIGIMDDRLIDPKPAVSVGMVMDPSGTLNWEQQSAAFIVA